MKPFTIDKNGILIPYKDFKDSNQEADLEVLLLEYFFEESKVLIYYTTRGKK